MLTILTKRVSYKTLDVIFLLLDEEKTRLKEGFRRSLKLSLSLSFLFLLFSCLLCYSVGIFEAKYSCKLFFLLEKYSHEEAHFSKVPK